jgi:endonuclease YncB( thermonuclease family)
LNKSHEQQGRISLRIERILVLSAVLGFCGFCFAETYTGRVVGIADGDTITVLESGNVQHKVRLSGIDAPEKKQPFGQVSKEHLSALIFEKTVSIETTKLDRYKREIGKVLLSGKDINIEQVKSGLAWHYKKYAKEQPAEDQRTYSVAEEQARAQKVGLWGEPEPVAPWDFRHK